MCAAFDTEGSSHRGTAVRFDVVDQPRPVRVLHLVKGLGPGGAERLLVSIASASNPDTVHHEVAYLLGWKQHLVPELEALGVPVHLLGGRAGMRDLRWLGRLRRLARTADVVHLHSPAPAAIARPMLRAMRDGPAVVSTEHNVWSSHTAVTRVANAATLPLDQVRWAVSNEVRSSAWRPWQAKTEVLVHGVPLDSLRARQGDRAATRAAHGWSEDDVVVATVANLRRNKDYPTLFAAAAEAIAVEPRLRFISLGQGPLEHELRAALARFDMGHRFVMAGYHDDPATVLAGADIFTLSSRHEGLPISLLEAMSLGVPPVVTSVGGSVEVVTDGVDGVLVPPAAPAALAAAYIRLAREPRDRARIGAAAATRAEDFDIARTARVVEARYRRITAR